MILNQDPMQDHIRDGVVLRHRVHTMVQYDINQAYKLAKSITHPWYKCQALADVADHSAKTAIKFLLQESFDSAMHCHDPNRRVSVACAPIRVALKYELTDLCNHFLDKCTEQLNQDMDPISKWCAARILYTIKKNSELLHDFYDVFAKAISKGHGWRVESEIKYMLNDPDIQKDERYISLLSARQTAIADWKKANKKQTGIPGCPSL